MPDFRRSYSPDDAAIAIRLLGAKDYEGFFKFEPIRETISEYARRCVCNKSDAPYLETDIKGELWKQISTGKFDYRKVDIGGFWPYFSKAVHYIGLRLGRMYHRNVQYLDDPNNIAAASDPEQDAKRKLIRSIINDMPHPDGTILRLHLDSYTFEEIAEMLGMKKTTVWEIAQRAKAYLRFHTQDPADE